MSGGATHVIYDAHSGDLLDGPMSQEHARYLVDRNYNDATWAEREGMPRPALSLAMCRTGELRRVQAGFARQMSGNPPKDRRATYAGTFG